MKICIVGPAHPYRGGLASIMEIMARTFASRGHDVGIKTFTVSTRSTPSTGGAWGAPFAANGPISC